MQSHYRFYLELTDGLLPARDFRWAFYPVLSLLLRELVPVDKENGWRRDFLWKNGCLPAGQVFEGRICALKRPGGILAYEVFEETDCGMAFFSRLWIWKPAQGGF